MAPCCNDSSYLAAVNKAIYAAMTAIDPDAVYVMQAWLFHESFWGPTEVKAFLSGVPDSGMLILDMNAELSPLWPVFDSFYGKPFAWCTCLWAVHLHRCDVSHCAWWCFALMLDALHCVFCSTDCWG
jgi:hypothetical protein